MSACHHTESISHRVSTLHLLYCRIPGKLKEFVDDLHSGKLHREFHHGPDVSCYNLLCYTFISCSYSAGCTHRTLSIYHPSAYLRGSILARKVQMKAACTSFVMCVWGPNVSPPAQQSGWTSLLPSPRPRQVHPQHSNNRHSNNRETHRHSRETRALPPPVHQKAPSENSDLTAHDTPYSEMNFDLYISGVKPSCRSL